MRDLVLTFHLAVVDVLLDRRQQQGHWNRIDPQRQVIVIRIGDNLRSQLINVASVVKVIEMAAAAAWLASQHHAQHSTDTRVSRLGQWLRQLRQRCCRWYCGFSICRFLLKKPPGDFN